MTYRVAVRALCEFVAKEGDLDLRFTPSPTALEGMEGHAKVAASRHADYLKEISLKGEYEDLVVQGRADGYDPRLKRLEEIKTHRGSLDRQPENHRKLHWAQLKIYGFLACEHFGLNELTLALVYFDIERERETVLTDTVSRETLEVFFNQTCATFMEWARQESYHRQQRDRTLSDLSFPMPAFRKGQYELAKNVYKAAKLERVLMLQAPTGIGKTLGTLFPKLKAMPVCELDRLFFLTAKTTGRQLAVEALRTINQSLTADFPQKLSLHTDSLDEASSLDNSSPRYIRGLELIARDKGCEHLDLACHGDSCPLAKGFYDRLPTARANAVHQVQQSGVVLDAPTLRSIALSADICPYYFGQEMARWADLVIGDYNHYYGMGGMLYALTQLQGWRVSVLLDEAHNLVERGRLMFSGELRESSVRFVSRNAPRGLGRSVKRLASVLAKASPASDESLSTGKPYDGELSGILSQVPSAVISELMAMTGRIGERLASQPDEPLDSAIMSLYFDALHFLSVHELYDARYFQCEYELMGADNKQLILRLRNNVPGSYLAPRFDQTHSTVLFSATLAPADYYHRLLGLPDNAVWKEVDSPFTSDQLDVKVVNHVSTRYKDRGASLQPIAKLIRDGFHTSPGNYLAFFSSFDYMEKVMALLTTESPDIPVWRQQRQMDEPARHAFIQQFSQQKEGVGFAVLGGVFGEGIDLPGNQLVGAFVATLGLPQFNPFNRALQQQLSQLFGIEKGYRYTYLYPGITKVIQAAGRVIRNEQDTGRLWLIDDRFAQKDIQQLLPAWWHCQC